MILKVRTGKYKKPIEIAEKGKRLWLKFGYDKALIAIVKSMEGYKWHGFDDPPVKQWSISNSQRNWFQLKYLSGENVYATYDQKISQSYESKYPLRTHQQYMASHAETMKQVVWAAEMGVGKSLAAMAVADKVRPKIAWWIAPKSALISVQLEIEKWKPETQFDLMTYENMVKKSRGFEENPVVPDFIVFDECHKIKTPTAQRSEAARFYADTSRELYKNPHIILMSGTTAPKAPTDWWHLCEVACPGFLKEGSIGSFKHRLAIISNEESVQGGVFPKLISWRDDENKCGVCGRFENDPIHAEHPFTPSKNEVAALYRRMKGLVTVTLKKDCLELPDKIYKVIHCEPNKSTLRVAQMISKTSGRAIQALTLLRELSDGFQYREGEGETDTYCPVCNGKGKETVYFDPDYPNDIPSEEALASGKLQTREEDCDNCKSTGKVKTKVRTVEKVECPKDNVILDLLDEHDDIGRMVIYAAFEASVDRCTNLCLKMGWDVIRIDGRGFEYISVHASETLDKLNAIRRFQNPADGHKIAFVAQPGSGGTGLTLTASPSIVYYSNSFNGEDRMQSEDRIHRIGIDENRGATIIDIFHLPTDEKILDNLKLKRKLQSITLGEIQNMMES